MSQLPFLAPRVKFGLLPLWCLLLLPVLAGGGGVTGQDDFAAPGGQPNPLRIELVQPIRLWTAAVTRQVPAPADRATLEAPSGLPTAAPPPASDDGVDLGFTPIGKLSIDIAPKSAGDFTSIPDNFSREYFASQPEIHYGPAVYHQQVLVPCRRLASEFSHGPVYFEHKNLERYGRTIGHLQPLESAFHFLVRVPALPYLTAAEPHWRDYYPSDPYMAGKPAPRVPEWPDFNLEAAGWETCVALGLVLLVP